MGFVRITTSIPKGDKEFCEDKRLSPAKLLQERISQIRDEENPALRENLKEALRRAEAMTRKVEFLAARQQKIFDLLPEKVAEDLIEKL